MGYFQHDAAHVLLSEEIFTGELQIVQGTHGVEEKRVAPPAGEEAIFSGFRHPCLSPRRDWCAFEDSLPAVARPGGLLALNTAQCPSLCTSLVGREDHAVCNIRDKIPAAINLQSLYFLLPSGYGCSTPSRA